MNAVAEGCTRKQAGRGSNGPLKKTFVCGKGGSAHRGAQKGRGENVSKHSLKEVPATNFCDVSFRNLKIRNLRHNCRYRAHVETFRNEELDSRMVVKYARVRRLERFAIRCMENDRLAQRKGSPNLHVGAIAA